MAAAPPVDALERLRAEAARPVPPRRMLVIVNPYATTVSDRLKHLVVAALGARYRVEAVDTEAKEHATAICRQAAHEGYDVVVAFGGDGTVNEAANGLLGAGTAFTALPGGRTNVFCRLLGIPTDVIDATEHLLRVADDFRPRPITIGMVGDRAFLFSSGVGLDARVVERVDSHPKLKVRGGEWYFGWAAISIFTRRFVLHPQRLAVDADGERIEGVAAFVQRSHPYTYFGERAIDVAEGAELDNEVLAGAVLRRASPLDVPTVIWRAFSARARVVRHRQVSGFAARSELRVQAIDGTPIPVQVDGDYIGELPAAVYRAAPGALRVVS